MISHPDGGKSTLTEALALHEQAITEAGVVGVRPKLPSRVRVNVPSYVAEEHGCGSWLRSSGWPETLAR